MHSELDGRGRHALGHGVCGRNRQRARDCHGRRAGRGQAGPLPVVFRLQGHSMPGRLSTRDVAIDAVLAGTGGCSAYDVVLILKRGRHDVRGCTVRLTSERAAVDPKVFTKIHMHFTVTGKGIPATAVERAIAMSHEKYCSASIMLGQMAEITTGFAQIEA